MGCTLEDTNEKINLLLREPTTIQSERSSTDLLVALIGFLNNCARRLLRRRRRPLLLRCCSVHSSIVLLLAEIQTSLSVSEPFVFDLIGWVSSRVCFLALR